MYLLFVCRYLRILGAFYLRLVGTSKEVYAHLEPLLLDYRKIRVRSMSGFELSHVDEIADLLLAEDRVFSVILPRLTRRVHLEMIEGFPPRISPLDSVLGEQSGGGQSDQE